MAGDYSFRLSVLVNMRPFHTIRILTHATRLRLFCAALPLCALAGCGIGTTPVTPPAVVDVYAAGFTTIPDSAGTLAKATYWKNGVATVLNTPYGAFAYGIAATDSGDIYVVGLETNSNGRNTAVYWKNGVATQLTDGTAEAASANGIFLSGDDVYIAGNELFFDPTNGAGSSKSEYWKNGSPIVLSTDSEGTEAEAIALNGDSVYVAGTQELTTQTSPNSYTTEPVATLWKDGVASSLTSGLQFAQTYGIAFSGTDVYVAGSNCAAFIPDCSIATFWKNGVAVAVTPNIGSAASGIAIAGNNIYVPVNQLTSDGGNAGELWSNGTLSVLSSTTQAAANSIATSGSDVYVGGADSNRAVYWLNGLETVLDYTGNQSSVFAIDVAPQP